MPTSRMLATAAAVLTLAACSPDEQTAPPGPSFTTTTQAVLSGSVLAPDGTNLCGHIDPGVLVVRVIDPVNATGSAPFAGAVNLPCPSNAFAIPMDPGTYRIRVQLNAGAGIGSFPFRYLDPANVVVGTTDLTHDVYVQPGLALGGGVTLDGSPFSGSPMSLVYAFPASVSFGAAFGVSGPDGAWDDAIPPRSPMLVQPGLAYRVFGECPLLGTDALTSFPSAPFSFPTGLTGISCHLQSGSLASSYSHRLTRLAVSMLPGDIGGLSPELVSSHGLGWGVQFPVPSAPAVGPRSLSHLWLGGLVIGVSPALTLSGVNVGGFMECGAACRDLGPDGSVKVVTPSPRGTQLQWKYSDEGSPDGVGLRVVQKSFDGKPPADYVLIQLAIENTSGATVTLYPGFFGDWDVAQNPGDNVAITDQGGRLMYVRNSDGTGPRLGTLLLGDYPVSGTYAITGPHPPLSLADQFAALSGGVSQPSGGPGDVRYLHAVGPVKLKKGKTAEFWIAIVAGEDDAQLMASVAAAETHAAEE